MEEYIELIEEFLRGQMSHEEEVTFKELLTTDALLRLLAFSITYLFRKQKTG